MASNSNGDSSESAEMIDQNAINKAIMDRLDKLQESMAAGPSFVEDEDDFEYVEQDKDGSEPSTNVTSNPEVLDYVEHCHIESIDNSCKYSMIGQQNFNEVQQSIITSEVDTLLHLGAVTLSQYGPGECLAPIFVNQGNAWPQFLLHLNQMGHIG